MAGVDSSVPGCCRKEEVLESGDKSCRSSGGGIHAAKLRLRGIERSHPKRQVSEKPPTRPRRRLSGGKNFHVAWNSGGRRLRLHLSHCELILQPNAGSTGARWCPNAEICPR